MDKAAIPDLRNVLERLQMSKYIRSRQAFLKEYCRQNYERNRLEERQLEESLRAKISTYSAAEIGEAERQRQADLEEANKYLAEEARLKSQEPRYATKLTVEERNNKRHAERTMLWAAAKSLGIKMKQIALEAFPQEPGDQTIDAFKTWRKGKAHGDGSFRDVRFRGALAKLVSKLAES